MSSHIRTNSEDGLTSNQQQLCCPAESSFPFFENEMRSDELHQSEEEVPNVKDTCSLFDVPIDDQECINDNLNIITHLKPINIISSEELSMDAAPEVTALLSTKPCPSEDDDETFSEKHRPKPNSPATMIQHRVKRKKKTTE